MPDNYSNIYGRYRRAAGLTQERAAELLDCAVRTLANWENGINTPPDEKVVLMCDVYQSQTLAIEHLRATISLARDIIPDIKIVPLSQAVCGLLGSIKTFINSDYDWALLDIASDGMVDELEIDEFMNLMELLEKIVEAALTLKYSEGGRNGKAYISRH